MFFTSAGSDMKSPPLSVSSMCFSAVSGSRLNFCCISAATLEV